MTNHGKDAVYLPPMRLVSFDEKVELLTGELLNLPTDSQEPLKELIRLCYHMVQGLDKRRLLSDAPTGKSNTDNPPGDTRLAGLLRRFNRGVERLQGRHRKQRSRLNGDMWELVAEFKEEMDKIEGWEDPERVKERLAKKAKEAQKGTCVTT